MDKLEVNSERIILEVQEHPYLYDMGDVDFKNRQKKRNGWLEVTCAVLGEEWLEMDGVRKTAAAKEIQKRWKNIRDSYFKFKKSEEGQVGKRAKKKKPYVFHRQLSFLQSVPQEQRTFQDIKEDQDEELSLLSSTSTEPPRISHGPPRFETPSSSPRTWKPEKLRSLSNKRKQDSFEQEVVDILKASMQSPQPQQSTVTDPDEMFLLSQIPYIKKFRPADKMDFQIKFIQLVQSYAYAQPN